MSSTQVPLLDLKRQTAALKPELMTAIEQVIDDGRFVLGPAVEAFEAAAASYLGARHAVGVGSGTDALWLALRAVGVGPGDLVLTSPFTFFATASAARATGARIVFADIDPATFNLDPAKVRDVLDGRCPVAHRLGVEPERIKAIIPVHLFGQAADVTAFERISEEYCVPLIEDAAQAMGARLGDRAVGNSQHMVCFSFFPSKNLGAFGDGGLVTTNDDDHASRVRLLRAHGSPRKYHHELLGKNSRLDAIQAAILGVKLQHLDGWISARRDHAKIYTDALDARTECAPPSCAKGRLHCYHQYTVRVLGGRRDSLQRHLDAHKIGSAIYYPIPLHLQEALADHGFEPGDYPLSEQAAKEALSLPIFPELTPREQTHVIEAVHAFFE